MGWFSKPKMSTTVDCPMCQTPMVGDSGRDSHLEQHVSQIPPGQGDASGQYTWDCTCGPAGMKWPGTGAATMALEYHLIRAHGLPENAFSSVLLGTFDRNQNYRYMRGPLGG